MTFSFKKQWSDVTNLINKDIDIKNKNWTLRKRLSNPSKKYRSLNLKRKIHCVPQLGYLCPSPVFFVFPPTFLAGLMHVFTSCGGSCVECEETRLSESQSRGYDGKCLCLRARAATCSSRRELVRMLFIRSAEQSVSKAFHQPSAHKNRKDSFSKWVTDWEE